MPVKYAWIVCGSLRTETIRSDADNTISVNEAIYLIAGISRNGLQAAIPKDYVELQPVMAHNVSRWPTYEEYRTLSDKDVFALGIDIIGELPHDESTGTGTDDENRESPKDS